MAILHPKERNAKKDKTVLQPCVCSIMLRARERASRPASRTRVSLRVLLSRDFSRLPQNGNLARRLVEV